MYCISLLHITNISKLNYFFCYVVFEWSDNGTFVKYFMNGCHNLRFSGVCGRSNTNQSVENWLGKCYWLDFNYCVQCVVVLTSFLSVGRNPKMPYFWLNVRSEFVQFWSFKLKRANFNRLHHIFYKSWINQFSTGSFFFNEAGFFHLDQNRIKMLIISHEFLSKLKIVHQKP